MLPGTGLVFRYTPLITVYKYHIPVIFIEDKRGLSYNASFKGILCHQNSVIENKDVGASFHWNRVYRGTTDEWWTPIEYGTRRRTYILSF